MEPSDIRLSEIKHVVLQEGDVLVFEFKEQMSPEAYRHSYDVLNEIFPQQQIVLLANGGRLAAILSGAQKILNSKDFTDLMEKIEGL